MDSSIKIISSERGKDLILIDTHKYRFRHQRKDGYIKWLCTNKKCGASILTTPDKKSVHESRGEHMHVNNTVQKIERQILRENCKRKCENNLSAKPLKILRTELLKAKTTQLVKEDIKTVLKTMYDRKKKHCRNIKNSSDEAIKPHKIETNKDNFFQYQGNPFVQDYIGI